MKRRLIAALALGVFALTNGCCTAGRRQQCCGPINHVGCTQQIANNWTRATNPPRLLSPSGWRSLSAG
jgi:hypothetical protein